jgi:hypothetical protein
MMTCEGLEFRYGTRKCPALRKHLGRLIITQLQLHIHALLEAYLKKILQSMINVWCVYFNKKNILNTSLIE